MNGNAIKVQRYSRIAMWLHWILAVLIIGNLLIGFNLDEVAGKSRGFAIYIHASIGFTVLGLVALRVLWRIATPPPELDKRIGGFEQLLARFGHFLLYACMVLVPLSGWAVISSNPPADSPGAAAVEALKVDAHPSSGFKVWGLLNVPSITPLNELGRTAEGVIPQSKLHHSLEHVHEFWASVLATMFLIHILAAAKHQWFDKVEMFARMGLGKSQKVSE